MLSGVNRRPLLSLVVLVVVEACAIVGIFTATRKIARRVSRPS